MILNFLFLISSFIIGVIIILLAIFIILNFSKAQPKNKVKKEKKSIVETASMTIFFIALYFVIRLKIGSFDYDNLIIRAPLIIISWIILIIGCYFNIKGRLMLGKNWANQVKIYKNQTLVKESVYSIVRHPLYASIIWMFYAASIIYFNWAAFLMNTLIFIPFMYYRAKQEEDLLLKEFKNYKDYKNNVGMFFPKIKKA